MVPEGQVLVVGSSGSRWVRGSERAEVFEGFIRTRARGPGLAVH